MLLEKEYAPIPGIGSLVVKRNPAHFVMVDQKINPPASSLLFENEIKNTELLYEYTSCYYDIPYSTAKQEVDSWVNKVENRLAQDHTAEIYNIGKFNIENEELTFNSHGIIENWFTKGLLPVIPIFVPPATEIQNQAQPSQKKERDYSLMIIPFVILLSLLTFGLKYYSENPFSFDQRTKISTPISNPIDSDILTTNDGDTTLTLQRDTCIIITGYFVKARYVLRMVDKIESLGYQPFIEDIADGTRVGLIIDCTDINLKDKIYKIRDSISKDAWYLEPPITIE